MAKKQTRKVPEINGGSLADIAFLLLIFFLVATTIDSDAGIARRLPPPVTEDTPINSEKINKRNIMMVLVNLNDDLLVQGERISIYELREKTKEFILNPNNSEHLPEKELLSAKLEKAKIEKNAKKISDLNSYITLLGDISISKGLVSLQNDRGTSYGVYIKVQNELTAAYNESREELAKEKFGESFDKLTEEKQDAIRFAIPMAISEAEPKQIGVK